MGVTDVTIIGAGVAGLCVAQCLLDRGAQVTLVDRHSEMGPHACSWWAGGMLAPYCEGESAEEPVVRLGLDAADWWAAKTQAVNHCGTLVVTAARDKSDLSRFARRTTGYRKVADAQITALEPELGKRFQNGLFFADEAHLSPRDALSQLRAGLAENGAVFLQDNADPRPMPNMG